MKAQHTPPPWKAENKTDFVVEENGRLIADCSVYREDGERRTNHANAKLIAASPDLLAVCKYALEAINAVKSEGFTLREINVLTGILSEEIRKAESPA